jgi:hypothetical protein
MSDGVLAIHILDSTSILSGIISGDFTDKKGSFRQKTDSF